MNDLQKLTAKAIVNIFETGRVNGDYGAVTVLKGDSGHLTYGRSQTTLGSGNLFLLIKAYCDRTDARYAKKLRRFLLPLSERNVLLDRDAELKELLREAGHEDPAMRSEQDRFFDANYFEPACRTALARNICTPLGQTVVYDSYVHGGFKTVASIVGTPCGAGGADEKEWIARYVACRKKWLSGLKPPLPSTVYRMDAFAELIKENVWELPLPLKVRGNIISIETLAADQPVVRASAVDPKDYPAIPLYLKSPYIRGAEVRTLQEALNLHGFSNAPDGIYGPLTEALVKQFQESKGLRVDGIVGPATRSALGI
jgi:chitosanase